MSNLIKTAIHIYFIYSKVLNFSNIPLKGLFLKNISN